MTKTYAIKRLLEHGPMHLDEIVSCTGWGYRTAWRAVCRCLTAGLIVRRQGVRYGFSYEATK